MSDLDIIIPVKNEEKNVTELTERIQAALSSAGISFTVIFVDDHSTDGTLGMLKVLAKKYPLKIVEKEGKPGKAFSILEGAKTASAPYIAMIDGDLQYPPEALPEMYRLAKEKGIVIAQRHDSRKSLLRKAGSVLNNYIFGKIILGLDYDLQSGLKVFKREVVSNLDISKVSPWTLDLPLVYTALGLGFSIGTVTIDFAERKNGRSKVNVLTTAAEIGLTALKIRFSKHPVFFIESEDEKSMKGAGVIHRGRHYITHTTLPLHHSAIHTFTGGQKLLILICVGFLLFGLKINPLVTGIVFTSFITLIYFLDLLFSSFLIFKSLEFPPEIAVNDDEISKLNDAELPVYTILCPMYREQKVLPHFLHSLSKIDYPKNKLEVLLLLEEDDRETLEAIGEMKLPDYVKPLIVPHSYPKTKPKACNYGLAHAKGEYIVIYDAEDMPDPLQLKKAYLAFKKLPENIVCLQAKLNYYNPDHNLLTRLFTAEYSLWFDISLPGLQLLETSIPLGGTSNHFKTASLKELKGWDPFNVTEDCDLGIRLFKKGYKTAIIDSVTLEEANSNLKNWLRQRSRWIKGYMQTYLVHMRSPWKFIKEQGIHAFIFQLVVGGKISFILINPLLWAATVSYFVLHALVGPTIEALYPPVIFYMAVISLVFGNFLYLYNYMIGCAKRDQWYLIKYVFLIPFYWLLVSNAALISLYQLIFKPHYWEKTRHGLHLNINYEDKENKRHIKPLFFGGAFNPYRITGLIKPDYATGGFLVFATVLTNFFNFLYNAYLVRAVSISEFGVINLLGGFVYFAQVFFGALSRTVTHKSAFLFGKYNMPVSSFWSSNRNKIFRLSLFVTFFWMLLIPFWRILFQTNDATPFLIFTPVWLIGMLAAIDSGYLAGNLKFILVGIVALLGPILKFILSVIFVRIGKENYIYSAVPLSMFFSFLIGWFLASRLHDNNSIIKDQNPDIQFPLKFFGTSFFIQLSTMVFLGFDIFLAKIYLRPEEAGQYALISLIGKMVYFIGSLFGQFIVPLVSKAEGMGKKSLPVFRKILLANIIVSMAGYIFFGFLGKYTAPLLWGSKVYGILYYLPLYCVSMAISAVTISIISFHQTRKQYLFPITSLLLGFIQVISLMIFHRNIETFVLVMIIFSIISLIVMLLLHSFYHESVYVLRTLQDFFGLFAKLPSQTPLAPGKLRILIFNWRDTKHKYAGGAEVYIHELSKRWVASGNEVTLFCGNDGLNPRTEKIDGIQIIRRGGFYFVYIWAFFYYILRFRGKFDVILDSENGIPFFTPLYARKKIFLLIHHVHQDVFRINLKPPFSWIGSALERNVMPIAYRNCEVVTVSPSSKADICAYGLTQKEPNVIYNGVDISRFYPGKKSKTPLILYLGRLRFHKSLHIFINVAKILIEKIPKVEFIIAGDGQEKIYLEKLAKVLNIYEHIKFIGKVTESEKLKLYQNAWVFVNPSLMEGWGITAIEANACGTPVVASNVSGLRDAVKNPHSGILVPYGDIPEFAYVIEKIISDRKLRNKMNNGALVWAKNFDWDKSADDLFHIMKQSYES